eukprot:353530-Chlamydomonas_euryale.AAC.5
MLLCTPGAAWRRTAHSGIPSVTVPSPLLDPLCLAALNTGLPCAGLLPVTLTLTLNGAGWPRMVLRHPACVCVGVVVVGGYYPEWRALAPIPMFLSPLSCCAQHRHTLRGSAPSNPDSDRPDASKHIRT